MSTRAQAEPPAGVTLDAFVSYSRLDAEPMLAFVAEARLRDRTMWVDADGIPPGAPWRAELGTAIEAANAVVCCVSPNWSASAECQREYRRAMELGKRLIPVMIEPGAAVPKALDELQRIDAGPSTDPAAVADQVITAIDVDPERTREHTHSLSRALRWDARGRDRSLLLRGSDLRAAEAWLARRGVEPSPIPLQAALVAASQRAERRRLRTAVIATLTTLAVTVALAVTAVVQRAEAVTQRDQAQSRALAAASVSQLDVDPERALLLASAAWSRASTTQALAALRSSVQRSLVRLTIGPHRDAISGIVWSPDGRTVVTSGRDGTVTASDTATGEPRGTVDLGGGAVEVLAGGASGVAVTERGRAVAWSLDPATGALRQGAVIAESGATSAAAAGAVVAVGMADGTVRVPTAATVRWGTAAVASVALSADGGTLLVGGADGTAQAGPAAADRPVVVARYGTAVSTVQLSGDGTTALAAADDGTAALVATRDGHQIMALPPAAHMALDPSGQRALVTRDDGQVSLHAVGRGPVALLDRGTLLADARFSPDGSRVVAGALDGEARVWASSGGAVLADLRGSTSPARRVALSPDGTRVVTGHADGTVRVWALPGPPTALQTGTAPAPLTGVDLTADGAAVVTAARNGSARTWDAGTGRETPTGDRCRTPPLDAGCLAGRTQLAHVRELTRALYSPDDRLIATASLSGRVVVWDAATAKPVSRPPGATAQVDDLAFAPDGGLLATAERGGTTRLIDPRAGDVRATFTDPAGEPVDAVAFTPDGRAVLTALDSGVLRRWEVGGGPSRVLADVGERVLRLAVGPTGRYAAIGTVTRIALVDLADGTVVRTLAGHRGFVTGVAFSPDGSMLFSGGKDGAVRAWDIPSGEPAGVFAIPGGDVSQIAVDHSGHRIAAVTTGGRGYVLDCESCGPPAELARLAAARATRSLTAEERATFDIP